MKKMTVLLIASNLDPASINIKKQLLELSNWKETTKFSNNTAYINQDIKDIILVTINDKKIIHENLEQEIEKELNLKIKQAIFLSRHRSKTGEPTLTVHPIGNYGAAEFGGKDKTLTTASPRLMTHLLRILKENAEKAKTYHEVCFEVTHHGPFMKAPTIFIEVGSTEEEWNKIPPAKIVAKSLIDLLKNYHYEEEMSEDIPVLVGIGGGHYAPRFTDIAFQKKSAFGHMIPNYHIQQGNLNDEILMKAIKATTNFKGVYIHRKSMKKSQVTALKKWFEEKNIQVISSNDLEDL